MQHQPGVLEPDREPQARPTVQRAQNIAAARRYVVMGVAGVTALPALAIARAPVHASPFQCVIAVLIALFAFAVGASATRGRVLPLVGVIGAGTGAWLLAQASYPVAAWLVAPVLGFGAGLAAGVLSRGRADAETMDAAPLPTRVPYQHAGEYARARTAVRREAAVRRSLDVSSIAAMLIASAAVAAGLVALRPGSDAMRRWLRALRSSRSRRRVSVSWPSSRRWPAAGAATLAVVALLLPLGTASYIGATTPRVTWFGGLDEPRPAVEQPGRH